MKNNRRKFLHEVRRKEKDLCRKFEKPANIKVKNKKTRQTHKYQPLTYTLEIPHD